MLAQVFLQMLQTYNRHGDLWPPFDDTFSEDSQKPDLSRIVIDRQYKIWLPDFGNREVQMTPLQKTLYLFFIKHPEGILLVNLPDYRKEIASIYYSLSGREDMEQIEQSIDELISPIGNSIHEKISRIRAAFKKIMDDSTARYYYVSGGRGAPQKISLPGDLIDLQF